MTPIKVLLIDDDETDRYIACRQLRRNRYIGEIVEADDGTVAYELFTSGRFHEKLGPHPPRSLVLLDINMPTMSGFELLERLEADGVIGPSEDSVVALLTSSAFFADRERAAGFDVVDGYLEKPLTADKVDALVTRFWPTDD